MAGIYSQGGSAGHRYAGWLETVEAKNFQFGGKVFNGSPSAIYVGSNLVWIGWLRDATKQAILGAFGQRDGMAVIKATNAYLNQLAVSDMDKATALAGFINEDPMMVCSLGLEVEGVTMPKRWIISLNGADNYFDLGIKGNLNTTIEMEVSPKTATTNKVIACFGNNTEISKAITIYTPTTGGSSRNSRFGNTVFSNSATQSIGSELTYKMNKTDLTINDVVVGTYNAATAFETESNLTLFKTNGAGSDYYNGEMWATFLKLGGDYVRWYVPFRKKSGDSYTCELLDLETGTLATRVGSFTIPDISYTPSTP